MGVELNVPNGLNDSELRSWLIDRICVLDAEKRVIKMQLLRYDQGDRGRGSKWRDRAQTKLDHLKDERECVRAMLSDVNQRIRATRALKNRGAHPIEPCQAFVGLAERYLAQDDYEWLWAQAQKAVNQSASTLLVKPK